MSRGLSLAPLCIGALFGCTGGMGVADGGGVDAGLLPGDPIDLVEALADPYAPARLRPGRPFLVSSREPEPAAGLLNRDHSYFVRADGDWRVMIDREGPGVITRWWMTVGGLPMGVEPEDVRVRLFVDGEPIDPDGGEEGLTLDTLTDGSVEGLAEPFTLGRDGTSGGLVVSQPIHYQRSFRADVEALDAWTYYQLEGYDYPPGTPVVPFTYPPSDAFLTYLDEAAALWRDHDHPGDEQAGDAVSLAEDASTELALVGPGVVTDLAVAVPREARADAELVLVVDGVEAVRAPLSWIAGSAAPSAASHASALAVVDPAELRLHYPLPFEASLVASVVNRGPATIVNVMLRARVVEGPLDPDLGRFHASCGVSGPIFAVELCGPSDPSLRADNHVVGRVAGARGHYVGHSLVQRTTHAWWCALETDHEVFVDGEHALLGTGLEDYYSAGFYWMHGPRVWALAGASGWVRDSADGRDTIHMFRHHLVDAIPFEDELRFEIESYIGETTFTGCSFFYLAPE